MVKDMRGKEIKIGDKVRVSSLIGRMEFTGIKTIEDIAPMNNVSGDLLWFEEGGGCHHPKAVEVLNEKNIM